MAQSAITLTDISKHYGLQSVLQGVCLSLPVGQFTALVGASGSGKTTLLKTINRLVAVDEGQVLINGVTAEATPSHLLRRQIGYVFQEIGLFPHLTVAENIAITPKLLGWTLERIQARVANLLGLVGLPLDMGSRLPAELSGGQRQRVGVARALAAEPQILLMDEPFGALDPVTREALGRDVRALHDQLSLTTVMVTHDMAEAILLADHIVVMKAGRIVAQGSPSALARDADPEVASLMDGPRRQAQMLSAKLGASA
jgi:osmoprotectant transport system ATP-binding protein